jgi:CheY-like chemotaxis protein
LVGNAVKFTEKGEILMVAQQVWRKAPTGDVPYLHLSVRDTGIGIAADKLQNIFEAFTQADASTTRKYGGTGLGLAITRKLASLMGGEIKVTSEAGKGSDFYLEFPLKVAPEMDEVRIEERNWINATAGTATCLVIGHGTLYELLRGHCQAWQIVPRTLPKESTQASVEEAVAPLQSVILDLGNADPVRAQLVLDVAAANRKPVVLLTPLTGGRAKDKVKMPPNGIHVRLSKPVKRRELLRTLADLEHHVREAAHGHAFAPAAAEEPQGGGFLPAAMPIAPMPAPFAPAAVDPVARPPTAPPAFAEAAASNYMSPMPAVPSNVSPQPQQQHMPMQQPALDMHVQQQALQAQQNGYYAGIPQQPGMMPGYMHPQMQPGYAPNMQGYPQQMGYPGYPQQMPQGYGQPMPQGYGQPMNYQPVPMMPAVPNYGQQQAMNMVPQNFAPPTPPPAAMHTPVPAAQGARPMANARPGASATAAAASENFARNFPARILLVDDQPLNHKIVTLFLQRLGYKNVDIAHNGQEGVEMVNRGGYDIVFMDLQMPVMGGVEAAREIRGNFLLKQQPAIIAMTGHALSGVKESCMEAGMNDFLTKPVSLDDFRRVIPQCLETVGAS